MTAPTYNDSNEARQAWLAAQHDAVDAECRRCRAAESLWVWGRLLTFFATAVLWYPLRGSTVLAGVCIALFAAAFAVSVVQHGRHKRRRISAESRRKMIEESQRRVGGTPVALRSSARPANANPGATWPSGVLATEPAWAITDQERDDLDLFDRAVSVFGLLNRTSCAAGARRLRDALERPLLSASLIRNRQAAVAWLAERPDRRVQLMAAAAGLRERKVDVDRFAAAVAGASVVPSRPAANVLRAVSVLTGGVAMFSLSMALVGHFRWSFLFLGIGFANMLVLLPNFKGWANWLDPWKTLGDTAVALSAVAQEAMAVLPAEGELGALRERFADVSRRGALHALAKRIPWADTGGAIHVLFNIYVYFDLHVAKRIEAAAVNHQDALLAAVAATADLEMLASLAAFAWEQPVCAFPTIDDTSRVQVSVGHHPLVSPGRSVPNDVRLDGDLRTWLITGPNMAGKSTLLRMVGVNTLLAQMGSAVNAAAMTWQPVRLITDLQARDNLANEESYFLAEVRHVLRMVTPPAGDAPVLGLIDEPFRGTNSDEQVAASIAVVNHLIDSGHNFLVATHTQELTQVPDGKSAANYHFDEKLDADGLVFDYSLRPGPAAHRNALKVLEREGYPRDLVDRANQWLADGKRS